MARLGLQIGTPAPRHHLLLLPPCSAGTPLSPYLGFAAGRQGMEGRAGKRRRKDEEERRDRGCGVK